MRAATKPRSAGPSGIDGSITASQSVSGGRPPTAIVRAVGAYARVLVAQPVVPGVDAVQQARARGHQLGRLLDDLAAELDLVQRAAQPERQVVAAAGVDAAAARLHARLVPRARPTVRQGPGEAGERAPAALAQELVADHGVR